jgi:hypothetical protein
MCFFSMIFIGFVVYNVYVYIIIISHYYFSLIDIYISIIINNYYFSLLFLITISL